MSEASPRPPAPGGVVPALFLVVLIWGASYPAIKVTQATIPVAALAALRCAGAAVAFLAWLLLRGRPLSFDRREWATVVLLGLAGNTIFQLCIVGGLRDTTPAHAALLISLNPVFAVLLAWLWLGERPGLARGAGILIALAGAGLILARAETDGATALRGDLLSLAAAAAWAVYCVAAKPILAVRPPLDVAAGAMLVGAGTLLPLGWPGVATVAWADLPPGTWALLGYLSVVTLGLAYVLWYWALARAATARVVAFSYLTPVVAAVISVASGQEPLTTTLVLGALTVLGGVALAQVA